MNGVGDFYISAMTWHSASHALVRFCLVPGDSLRDGYMS